MSKKIDFSDVEINNIKKLYLNDKLSCRSIGELYNMSREPIETLLKNLGLLRSGRSNGIKIQLDDKKKEDIKRMYVEEYKSKKEIAKTIGITNSYLDKYLGTVNYRRNKSEAASVGLVRRYSGINYNDFLKTNSEFKKYTSDVIKVTRQQPIEILNNYNRRGRSGIDGAYHLDHKYSIAEGFRNNINPELIGNIKNLEFIPWEDNVKKRVSCSITLNELILF